MAYYKKVNGEILLTEAGHFVLSFFGLSMEDLQVMSKEQLIAHTKKFSDVLNDGSVHKSGKFEDNHILDSETTKNAYGKYNRKSADKQISYGHSGSYSRYFSLDQWADKTLPFLICPKPSKRERGEGNVHPTVKSLKLMSYLITMGSREGDLVLDPFSGSGTVLIAADQLHRKWLGIEMNPEYAEIIKRRLMVPLSQLKLSIF